MIKLITLYLSFLLNFVLLNVPGKNLRSEKASIYYIFRELVAKIDSKSINILTTNLTARESYLTEISWTHRILVFLRGICMESSFLHWAKREKSIDLIATL